MGVHFNHSKPKDVAMVDGALDENEKKLQSELDVKALIDDKIKELVAESKRSGDVWLYDARSVLIAAICMTRPHFMWFERL